MPATSTVAAPRVIVAEPMDPFTLTASISATKLGTSAAVRVNRMVVELMTQDSSEGFSANGAACEFSQACMHQSSYEDGSWEC